MVKPWKTLSSRYLVDDHWMKLRADRCETAQGAVIDPYYVIEPRDWVHIVALNQHNEVLITEQYRHGARQICLELPCGEVEANETPLEAACRELREETGAQAAEFEPLRPYSPNPARYSNLIYPFLARGTTVTTQQQLDPTEEISFRFMPIAELLEEIRSGRFGQALHVACLFTALDRLGLIQLPAVSK